MSQEGSFQVTYIEGIAGEADAEIIDRKFKGMSWPLQGLILDNEGLETLTVTVGSIAVPTCTNLQDVDSSIWTPSGPLWEVEVGSVAEFEFDGISNGDCPYMLSTDYNQAKLTFGDALTQLKV